MVEKECKMDGLKNAELLLMFKYNSMAETVFYCRTSSTFWMDFEVEKNQDAVSPQNPYDSYTWDTND
jgi:hypothetical protein